MTQSKPTTISALLKQQSGQLQSRVDAEALLLHILQKPRSYLYTWPEQTLSPQQYRQFCQLCQQRQQGQPIAYLTGQKEFYSRNFTVNTHTLIPRPETELLIDLALDYLADKPANSHILDLGTGSGIIAITLACETGNRHNIDAVDTSEQTLLIAQKNAKEHHAKVNFIQSNWFENLPHKPYQLIISNPPYIEQNDEHLQKGDLRFEPLSALASGKQGMDAIKQIIQQSKAYLDKGAMLMLEHGYNQKNLVQKHLQQQGFDAISTFQDYSQNDRVTIARHA